MPDPFVGTHTALVTPMTADGSVDEAVLGGLVTRQIDEGVDGLVVCGTTGESATLTRDEQLRVIESVIAHAGGRIAITAGAGGNSTVEVVDFVRRLEGLGVDAVLSVVPYYNKPTQAGLVAHFTAIADASPAPVMMYNVPGRTGQNMEADTTVELARHPRIQGVKEASGDLGQASRIAQEAPPGFRLLSGDDSLALPLIALGATGLVSVVSNVDPGRTGRMIRAALTGETAVAGELQDELAVLTSLCFVEANPIPAKAALAAMGFLEESLRLPLVPLADEHRPALLAELERLGLLGDSEGKDDGEEESE
jgi:4-hydroxy-tetrahydrodipicolinate synthase